MEVVEDCEVTLFYMLGIDAKAGNSYNDTNVLKRNCSYKAIDLKDVRDKTIELCYYRVHISFRDNYLPFYTLLGIHLIYNCVFENSLELCLASI